MTIPSKSDAPMKPARAAASRPAYRKFTDRVRGGLRYALASLEFDLEHGPTCDVALPITDDQLQAAAEYLRYKLASGTDEAPTEPPAGASVQDG